MNNLEDANNEIEQILAKYNIAIGYEMYFPAYKILPKEVQLAIEVLARNDMRIIFKLQDK